MSKIEFIDNTILLGMHSIKESLRIACKNFFVERIYNNKFIYINFEQIGICDHKIWNMPEILQNYYWPFIDSLHSTTKIKREGYLYEDIKNVLDNKKIDLSDKLAINMAINKGAVLYTLNKKLKDVDNVIFLSLSENKELNFSDKLEELYQESLKLRLI